MPNFAFQTISLKTPSFSSLTKSNTSTSFTFNPIPPTPSLYQQNLNRFTPLRPSFVCLVQLFLSSMEGVGSESGDGAVASPEALVKWRRDLGMKFQYYLDRSVPHTSRRWLGTLAVAALYILRVYYVKGFYVVSYGLATYVLNMLIGFFSPVVNPELEGLDGASSPSREPDESKPRFIRRLPEFRFWYAVTKAFVVSFLLTFISVLDVPVFWPILLSYWLFLFAVTMKRQIAHMIRYKYNPFSTQKLRHENKDSSTTETQSGFSRD